MWSYARAGIWKGRGKEGGRKGEGVREGERERGLQCQQLSQLKSRSGFRSSQSPHRADKKQHIQLGDIIRLRERHGRRP